MQISGAEVMVVMAANKGFGGRELNTQMAQAVQHVSSNHAMRNAESRHMAAAMESIMPPAQSAQVRDASEISASTIRSSGHNEPGKGI